MAIARLLRRSGRRVLRGFAAAPWTVKLCAGALAALALWAGANWAYQVARKPSELFFPVSDALTKAPAETWREYGPLFREYSTAAIPPDLLAALAQVEGGGNPVARAPWRWRLSWHPFEIYGPASSAAGMYQITDGVFVEAKRYCIHDHKVVEDGPWYAWRSCWFNGLYMRVVPRHAIEMTAALLSHKVARVLARLKIADATPRQRQDLAAVIHLCGAAAGEAYAKRGFRLAPGQRCGGHDAGDYLARVAALKRRFARMAAQ